MIKSSIQNIYPHQYNILSTLTDNIYVADFTEQTKSQFIKRSVEFFSPNPPSNIDYFSVINGVKLLIGGIKFDNNSFIYNNGQPKTQCEATFFPIVSNDNSWILFCELKYSYKTVNNSNNLRKAIKQLYKTRYYYVQERIICSTNTTYLVASLPMQSEPFSNFAITPSMLIKLKRIKNIILRLSNKVEIINNQQILV
jgi:hypothetical protein